MHDAAPVMGKDEQDKQHLGGHGRHHKEIEGDQLLDMGSDSLVTCAESVP
jgi:hypothetical protein